jgi:hypothetical protein
MGQFVSSNPSLDAFNQALTNAQATNPTLDAASVLLAVATPAQLQQATAALQGSSTSWFSQETIIPGISNGAALVGTVTFTLVLYAVLRATKGEER